jgi:bifunctional non-homologous end joining protein LigD
LTTHVPAGDDWLHELKYDGYRIVAHARAGTVELKSRRAHDWTDKFPSIVKAVGKLPLSSAIIDGEVAVAMPDGRTSFGALQAALSAGAAKGVTYYVFDLLYLDGRSLTGLPLETRKRMLQELVGSAKAPLPIRYSDHVVGNGPAFFAQVQARGLEGIVSKRRQDVYREGRSAGWLKIKATQRQELVVGGYTAPEGSREAFGSLIVGVYDDSGLLRFSGGVGTGFDEKTLRHLGKRLQALRQDKCPFTPVPPKELLRRPPHWIRPELVVEVEFLEWTSDGHLRHPSFRGLREDRAPEEVRRERPVGTSSLASPAPAAAAPPAEKPSRRAVTSSRSPVVLGQRLTNPARVFYPDLGLTKLDLARYYEAVGEAMLPHVAGRPLSLVRCPEGLNGDCFYAKHVATGGGTPLVQVMIKEKATDDAPEPFLIVRDAPGLVALSQLGVLEVHTWNSVADRVDHPNRFVMDLDPGPEVAWSDVVEAARLVHEVLRAVGFESYLKTTGGKGLHIVVPVAPVLDWDANLALSRAIAGLIVRQDPRKYTISLPKAGRERKILIDYLRNHRGSTSVAAFSTRRQPTATVSVPITWDELGPAVAPGTFTVANVPDRLRELGRHDPWEGYWTNRQQVRSDLASLLVP